MGKSGLTAAREPVSFLWPILLVIGISLATYIMSALIFGLVLIVLVLGIYFGLRALGNPPGSSRILVGATLLLLAGAAVLRGATTTLPVAPAGAPLELTSLAEATNGDMLRGTDTYLVFYETDGLTRLFIEMPQVPDALRGYWAYDRASVVAQGALRGGFGATAAVAPSWGESIRNGVDVERIPAQPSFEVEVPLTAEHRYQWIDLEATMDVIYPFLRDSRTFAEGTKPLARDIRILVAGPEEAGLRQGVNDYRAIRKTLDELPGPIGVLAVFIVGGLLLVWGAYPAFVVSSRPEAQKALTAKEPARKADKKGKPAQKESQAIMKRGTGLKDVVQVLLIALVFGALFTGIAIGVSLAMGARIGAGGNGDGTDEPTAVAAVATPAPGETAVPTEVPCDAPVWWLTTGPGLATTISDLLGLDVSLPPAQIKQTSDQFNIWRTAFAAVAYPPCVGAARDALADFAARGRSLLDAYLTTTTDSQRGQLTLNMLNSLLTAADEVTALGVARPDGAEDRWIADVQDFHRNTCPAAKWFLETMLARDYQRFFSILGNTSLSTMSIAEIQEQLRSMRTLRDAYRTDMAGFPECVKPASDRLLGGMDAFLDTINQQLNGDPNASSSALERAKLEVSSFFAQVAQLLPAEDQGLLQGAQAELAATPST